MDPKQDILEQLREGLRNCEDYYKSDGGYSSGHDYIDTMSTATTTEIDFSDINCSITLPSATFNWPNASPNVYMTSSSITGANIANGIDTITIGSPLWQDGSGKIRLDGDDADIEIKGQSLMSMIQGIQDRLNMLCPDPSMEAEWDDLRVLREQYEAKLAECREKSHAWKALKNSG